MYADKLYSLNDEALLNHYHQTRNFTAFKLLYQRYKDPLFRYCIQISPTRGYKVLESLWQEVLAAPPKLECRNLSNWFYIQINRKLHSGSIGNSVKKIEIDGSQPSLNEIEAQAQIDTVLKEPVLNAVQQLPRQQRNVFLLHRECRLSLATVADIERLTLKQCKDCLHQALHTLEETLHGSAHRAWKIAAKREPLTLPEAQIQPNRISIWQRIKEKASIWSTRPKGGNAHPPGSGAEKIA